MTISMREVAGVVISSLIIITYLALLVMYPSHPIPERLMNLVYIAIGFLFNTGSQIGGAILKRLGF